MCTTKSAMHIPFSVSLQPSAGRKEISVVGIHMKKLMRLVFIKTKEKVMLCDLTNHCLTNKLTMQMRLIERQDAVACTRLLFRKRLRETEHAP